MPFVPRFPLFWLPACAAAWLGACPLSAPAQDAAEIRSQVGDSGVDRLKKFYADRDHQPVWSPEYRQALAEFLMRLDAHGLSPGLFHLDHWQKRWRVVSSTAAERAKTDIETTHLASYAVQSLAYGFVDPVQAHPRWELIARKISPFDLLREARKQTPDRFAAWLENATAPADPRYRELVEALAKYRKIEQFGGWRPLPATARPVSPGDEYPHLKLLRARLGAEGDLDGGLRKFRGNTIDAETANALKSFQFRHGITPDAVIGPQTLAELNIPADRRIDTLIINLDRLRWMPRAYEEDEHIEVNIAEGALRIFNRGQSAGTMRVIVGIKGLHQTPVFHGRIHYLIFRPYWNVPPSIAKNEVVPEALADPTYVQRERYEVVPFFGVGPEKVLPATPENLQKVAGGQLAIRQGTGPNNALGLVKFIFPNDNSVYLHDTPNHNLFRATDRDFSHGCVRVSKPDELANYVLRDNGQWTLPGVRGAMEDTTNPSRKVDLATKIPVYLVYWTSTIMDDGRVRFDQDIYGHDETMRQRFGLGLRAASRAQ